MATDNANRPEDPTPIVAAPTDIAPLTHRGPKPPHEQTADEEGGVIDWEKLAGSERFRSLLKAKKRFIIPAMIFFVVYYFALPVLIGYARPFMEKRVLGPVNPGVSVCALAILHGLDYRRALCAGGRAVRPNGGGGNRAAE
jgi:uncharacterized membrane protein (DUF485 family)